MDRGGSVKTVALVLAMTAAAALPSVAGAEGAGEQPSAHEQPSATRQVTKQSPHGAQDMAEQEAALASMQPAATLTGVPRGVDPDLWNSLIPADNKLTPARISLGRKLYFDVRLSKDGQVACATCHDVARGFTDHRPVSEGIGDQLGRRNAPTTLNAVFFHTQFWDGRAKTLEEQAGMPILNPIEMGMPNKAAAVKAIAGDAQYQKMFKAAYGSAVNYGDIERAIAAFERTLVFIDAPFDKFLAGDTKALSPAATAGWVLFNGKARCVSCHWLTSFNPLGSDNKFHNVGVSAKHRDFEGLAAKALKLLAKDDSDAALDKLALETDFSELGRFVVTRNRSDIGAFKTQQVRNVGVTAPYMHDGSMKTLWDVVDHYNKGGESNLYLDGGVEALNLSEQEVDQLVAFMFSLTDDRFAAANMAEMKRQRTIAADKRPNRDDDLKSRKVIGFERRVLGPKGKQP